MRLGWRLGVAVALAALSACESKPRPDFLARVQQDCAGGSAEACSLLQAMQALSEEPASAASAPARQARIRSQAKRNTDAIMQGVDRARAAPRPTRIELPNDGQV